jgi:hypothetical protein
VKALCWGAGAAVGAAATLGPQASAGGIFVAGIAGAEASLCSDWVDGWDSDVHVDPPPFPDIPVDPPPTGPVTQTQPDDPPPPPDGGGGGGGGDGGDAGGGAGGGDGGPDDKKPTHEED